jgi:hypothetical protein
VDEAVAAAAAAPAARSGSEADKATAAAAALAAHSGRRAVRRRGPWRRELPQLVKKPPTRASTASPRCARKKPPPAEVLNEQKCGTSIEKKRNEHKNRGNKQRIEDLLRTPDAKQKFNPVTSKLLVSRTRERQNRAVFHFYTDLYFAEF